MDVTANVYKIKYEQFSAHRNAGDAESGVFCIMFRSRSLCFSWKENCLLFSALALAFWQPCA